MPVTKTQHTNIEILANTIERNLPVSINMVSLQYLDYVISKYTRSVEVQCEIRTILFNRKCSTIRTYADYLNKDM